MSPNSAPDRKRLDGWAEIAHHMQVTPRTAQRWQQAFGLPIHREERQKRAQVFAFSDELDGWRQTRQTPPMSSTPTAITPVGSTTLGPAIHTPSQTTFFRKRRTIAALMTLIVLIFIAVGVIVQGRTNKSVAIPFPDTGRLLARATSEAHAPSRFLIGYAPHQMVVSRDGGKLFASNPRSRVLTIVETSTGIVRNLSLPREASALAIAPNGLLYIGSPIDGISIVNVGSGGLYPETIATGGPVRDMAITPDGTRLFLALEQSGLKRLFTETGKIGQVSDSICPVNLAIDPQGKNLYVAYQCSGADGVRGRDPVEVFDLRREESNGIIQGMPMVGSNISVSPNGKFVLLDGKDACIQPSYAPHTGCPSVPGRVHHLIRISDLHLLRSFGFEKGFMPDAFLDNSRFLSYGTSLMVANVVKYTSNNRYTWDEKLDLEDTVSSVAFDLPRRRVYLGLEQSHTIVMLEMDAAECSQPANGLGLYYTGDGTVEDTVGLAALEVHGALIYKPGRVGQAFFLDGNSYLEATWTGRYQFFLQNSSIAFYMKTTKLSGEANLIDWNTTTLGIGFRLFQSATGNVVFESPGGNRIVSPKALQADIWHHIAVTSADRDVTLYINGESQGSVPALPTGVYDLRSLSIGGMGGKQTGFHGLLDEIAFYGRALNSSEIKRMYQARESGPCKI